MLSVLLTPLLDRLFGVVDEAVVDKDLARTLKAEIQTKILENNARELEAAARVIVAEAQGESWLQRSWRPLTMLSFVAIMVNNFILVPYARAFGAEVPMLDIPAGMWGLLTTGIGGYVVSRGVEKGLKTWRAVDQTTADR